MMGAFFIIAFNAKKISDDFKEKIPITIYLKNNATKIETEQLIKKLNLKDYTNSISYISKEKGAEMLINEIGEDFIEFYGTNPLLNSIDVFLKSEFVTTIVFDEITNELNNTDFIDEIILGLFDKKNKESSKFSISIIISMIPAVLIGLFLKKRSILFLMEIYF